MQRNIEKLKEHRRREKRQNMNYIRYADDVLLIVDTKNKLHVVVLSVHDPGLLNRSRGLSHASFLG